MTIIIPMAGGSTRFYNAGFSNPKYMLEINNESVFYHSVSSFKKYFRTAKFLFIYRQIGKTHEFIDNECRKLKINDYSLIKLEKETEGQAHTVALGMRLADIPIEEEILIFNIDTFRPGYIFPNKLNSDLDGYLEVFEGEGDHWSFIKIKEDRVIRTTEKNRISRLCSDGLYFFKKAGDYLYYFERKYRSKDKEKNEYYIAPLYNDLISDNKVIRYNKIKREEIEFCGTPEEYYMLVNKYKSMDLVIK